MISEIFLYPLLPTVKEGCFLPLYIHCEQGAWRPWHPYWATQNSSQLLCNRQVWSSMLCACVLLTEAFITCMLRLSLGNRHDSIAPSVRHVSQILYPISGNFQLFSSWMLKRIFPSKNNSINAFATSMKLQDLALLLRVWESILHYVFSIQKGTIALSLMVFP